MQSVVNAYAHAFSRCYPHARLEFKTAKGGKVWVVLDGDKGDRPLTLAEMSEAAVMLSA